MRMTTVSSGLIKTQALISGVAVCAAASVPNGTWKPSVRPAAAPEARKLRRDSWMFMSAPSTHVRGGELDCRLDAIVGAAAADVGHLGRDLLVGRLLGRLQQRCR